MLIKFCYSPAPRRQGQFKKVTTATPRGANQHGQRHLRRTRISPILHGLARVHRVSRVLGAGDGAVVPLPFSPCPIPGENLHGYLRRLAEANGHSSMGIFLKAINLRGRRFGPTSDVPEWNRLALLTLLQAKAFATMRWRSARTSKGRPLEFLGSRIDHGHLHPRNMRFCPSCLREDGIRRDFWSLAKVVACPRHATLMADACPGCSEPYSTTSLLNHNACRCGFRLTDVFTKPASAAATTVSRNLTIIIGTKLAVGVQDHSWQIDFPPPFRGIGANDYLSYLELLGVAESTPEAEDLQKGELSNTYGRITRGQQLPLVSALAIVEAGHRIIQGWPTSFTSLLERVDGRGQAFDEKATPSQAFSTVVGRSLRLSYRGEDGLPLRLIHSSFDAYWREKHGRRRKRNPSVRDVNAKRIFSFFNGAALARAMGFLNPRPLHGRVFERVVANLTEEEKSFSPEALTELLRARSITLYAAASSAVTPLSARRRLEDFKGGRRISGWNHPELLQPDPELASLRLISEVYSERSLSDVLDRLSKIAVRVESPGTLVPLMFVAVRYRHKRQTLTKTELLLQIFRGTLRVSCIVDNPTLRDLYIEADDLSVVIVGQRVQQSISPYMSKTALDRLVTYLHGGVAIITVDILYRLVRAGLVRSETRAINAKNLQRETFFHHDDVSAIMSRLLSCIEI